MNVIFSFHPSAIGLQPPLLPHEHKDPNLFTSSSSSSTTTTTTATPSPSPSTQPTKVKIEDVISIRFGSIDENDANEAKNQKPSFLINKSTAVPAFQNRIQITKDNRPQFDAVRLNQVGSAPFFQRTGDKLIHIKCINNRT